MPTYAPAAPRRVIPRPSTGPVGPLAGNVRPVGPLAGNVRVTA
ncbi:hypothetical protein [Kitasatospora sp. NBC_00315]